MQTTDGAFQGRLATLTAILLTTGLLLAASSMHAELLFSDSFDYQSGSLGGKGPPPGSPPGQGGWVIINQNPRVAPSGLDFPEIGTAGKSAKLFSIPDTVSDEAVATVGPVTPDLGAVWVGFLTRRSDDSNSRGGFAVVALIGPSILDPSLGIGMLFETNRYGLDNDTGERGSRSITSVPVNGETTWLVTKLDFATGQEYLWVSPSPDMEPDIATADAQLPMTPEFQAAGFPYVRLRVGYTHASFQFDELRIGTTFADLVEPEVF
jgi:hypothetical protein